MSIFALSRLPLRLLSVGSMILSFGLLTIPGCQIGDADDESPVTIEDEDSDAGSSSGDGDASADPGGSPGPDAAPTDASHPPDSPPRSDTGSPATPGSDSGDPGETGDNTGETPSDCTTTQRYCEGACRDVLEDPDHCGSCGFSCSEGASCVNGICKCAPGDIRCDGRCIDPTSNDDHCFDCGNACPSGKACVDSVCIEHDREATAIELINEVRQSPTDCGQYGIKPAGPKLERNGELEAAAQTYAERMAEKDFFAHDDPYDGSDFVERVARTDYMGTVLGENLSRGRRQSAERMVNGWKGSDSHCRVMTNPDATEYGLGLAEPSSGTYDSYWVLLVGRP